MRLDLFLKASRLSPRRTVAQQLCDAGAVSVNGAPARSSRAINIGDEITIRRPRHIITVRVTDVPTTRQTPKSNAATLYTIVKEEQRAPESLID